MKAPSFTSMTSYFLQMNYFIPFTRLFACNIEWELVIGEMFLKSHVVVSRLPYIFECLIDGVYDVCALYLMYH